ncbi:MAG: bifunctional diguanylate cyclase/phosphodiesterase [Gammaproteobacteria bacterium]|nr:bifunctional diguanylate cyclase/phosphodiesterase [Gammaproteobacteria bacterium]
MSERPKGLSIGGYAVLMVVLLLLAVFSYGGFTYSEFQRVRADVEAASRVAARTEVVDAMDRELRAAHDVAMKFAAWDEVARQLDDPRDYASWRERRMRDEGLLPDRVVDAEVYATDGHALANLDDASLPRQVAIPPPPAYVDYSGPRPTLLLFRAVHDETHTLGYVGLRVAFLDPLRNAYGYRYADPATIDFTPVEVDTLAWSDLKANMQFQLRANPMDDAVSGLLSGTLLNLSIILGVFTMLLFPALVFLIVRPLRAISAHIDRLKDSPGGLVLEDLAGILPIAETEKIRESLNAYQGQLVDVHSSLEEKSRELWAMAHHDALTGAKNRRAFEEFMRNLPRTPGARTVDVCFALFDVNHFKAINDTYGHSVGDQVLKAIADRISSVLRKGEELFRIGGDEFAVILLDCDESSALRIAERCHEKIVHHDFSKLGIREPMRISAGLAIARIDDLEDLQTLQWKADVAMYRAKRPGHANVVMFSEALARDSEGLFSSWVNTAVYDAVVYGKGLEMYYQPIVDLTEGNICHYEALVRIEQDGELIQPSNIFPVIEARRLEVELDRAVIRKVLQDLGNGVVRAGTGVSINLSGPTLVQDQVCEWLSGFVPLLKDYRVMIEVTETALITQIGLANENLTRLRALGFDIALDDFGSGYSSVRYLASMPVDVVKFDISLIQGLQDPHQANMVVHLAQMILESGHHLVAEGIEDQATLESVRAAGFARGQGYLMGRPAERGTLRNVSFDNVTRFPNDRIA